MKKQILVLVSTLSFLFLQTVLAQPVAPVAGPVSDLPKTVRGAWYMASYTAEICATFAPETPSAEIDAASAPRVDTPTRDRGIITQTPCPMENRIGACSFDAAHSQTHYPMTIYTYVPGREEDARYSCTSGNGTFHPVRGGSARRASHR